MSYSDNISYVDSSFSLLLEWSVSKENDTTNTQDSHESLIQFYFSFIGKFDESTQGDDKDLYDYFIKVSSILFNEFLKTIVISNDLSNSNLKYNALNFLNSDVLSNQNNLNVTNLRCCLLERYVTIIQSSEELKMTQFESNIKDMLELNMILSILSICCRHAVVIDYFVDKFGLNLMHCIVKTVNSISQSIDEMIILWSDCSNTTSKYQYMISVNSFHLMNLLLHLVNISISLISVKEFPNKNGNDGKLIFTISHTSKILNGFSESFTTKIAPLRIGNTTYQKELVQYDNVKGLLSIFRKLSHLSKLFNQTQLSFDSNDELLYLQMKSLSTRVLWRLTVIIQVRILSLCQNLSTYDIVKFIDIFVQCDWNYSIEPIFKCQDIDIFSKYVQSDIILLSHRMQIILDIIVITIKELSKYRNYELIEDIFAITSSLNNYMSWISRIAGYFDDIYNISSDSSLVSNCVEFYCPRKVILPSNNAMNTTNSYQIECDPKDRSYFGSIYYQSKTNVSNMYSSHLNDTYLEFLSQSQHNVILLNFVNSIYEILSSFDMTILSVEKDTYLLAKYLSIITNSFCTSTISINSLFQYHLINFIDKVICSIVSISNDKIKKVYLGILANINLWQILVPNGTNMSDLSNSSFGIESLFVDDKSKSNNVRRGWYTVTFKSDFNINYLSSSAFNILCRDYCLDVLSHLVKLWNSYGCDYSDIVILLYDKMLENINSYEFCIQISRFLSIEIYKLRRIEQLLNISEIAVTNLLGIMKEFITTMSSIDIFPDDLKLCSKNYPLFYICRESIFQLLYDVMIYSKDSTWIKVFINSNDLISSMSAPVSRQNTLTGETVVVNESYLDIKEEINVRKRMSSFENVIECIPLSRSTSVQVSPQAISQNISRHSILLRFVLYPRSRDAALSLISIVMKNSLNIFSRSIDDSPSLKTEQRSAKALLHELIRGFISIMRYSSGQPEYTEGFLTSIAVLSNLRFLVSDPRQTSTKLYQQLFNSYRPTVSSSKSSWKKIFPCIYSDIYESLLENYSQMSNKTTWNKEMRSHLLHHSLYLLKCLLYNNEEAKLIFYKLLFSKYRNKLFYHDFIELIVKIESFDTSFGTFCILLEVLFESDFDFDSLFNESIDDSSNLFSRVSKFSKILTINEGLFSSNDTYVPTFANVSILPILFELLKYCDETLQLSILYTYKQTMNLSKVNFYKCVHMEEPSMIELILDLMKHLSQQEKFSKKVFTVLGDLFRDIGLHMINVSQLKRTCMLMNMRSINNRIVMIDVIVNSLIGMIDYRRGPNSFILCHGEESGLLLPRVEVWPPTKGYSISLWFSFSGYRDLTKLSQGDTKNILQFKNPFNQATKKMNRPTLISMRNLNGSGLEIYFDNIKTNSNNCEYYSKLYAKVYTSTGKESFKISIDVENYAITSNDSWHHIAISHIPSFFRKNSDIYVSFDGNISKDTLQFPKSGQVIEPLIGNSLFNENDISKAFYGKLGAIYFFSESLSEIQLHNIYQLGPNYNEIFNMKTNDLNEFTNEKIFDGTLTSLISLAYNPGIYIDKYILDITPEKNMFKWNDKIENTNALRRNCTYKCQSRNMVKAFDCLGGSKVLLYILAEIDNIVSMDCDNLLFDSISLFNKILNLFFKTLHKSAINIKFIKDNGFANLAIIMETVSSMHIDDVSISLLLSNLNNEDWSNEWKQSFIKEILLNFRIWSQTSFKILRSILLWIVEYIEKLNNFDSFNNLIQIHKWVDIIHTYFNDRNSTDRSIFDFDEKPSVFVSQLSMQELIDVRQLLHQIIYIQLCMNPSYFDIIVNQLVSYCLIITSPNQIIENLQFFLRLLSVEKPQFIDLLLSTPASYISLKILTSLFRHDNPKVRLYSIICYFSIIQLACEFGKFPSSIKHFNDLKLEDDKNNYKVNIVEEIVKQYLDDTASTFLSQSLDSIYNPIMMSYHSLLFKLRDIDSFTIIGIPVFQCPDVFISFIDEILSKISKSSDECNKEFIQAQIEIIFQIFHLTMHGLSCKRLIDDIEKINSISEPTNNDVIIKRSSLSNDSIDTKITRKYSYNGNYTATMRICLSVILPSLLNMVKRTDIVDSASRKRFLLDVKSSLQSFANIESVISIPNWQNYFLDVLVSEQAVMDQISEQLYVTKGWNGDFIQPSFSNCECNIRTDMDLISLKESHSITEIVIHTISSIHLHAFRYGNPPRDYQVFKPEELNEVTYSKMNMKDLFELYREGNRRIGAEVLRETIGTLRSYGEREQSAFNARLLGLELLQHTMTALQQENETLLNSVNENQDMRTIRRKLFELNIWMITFVILEYVTLPPIQQARSMRHSMSFKVNQQSRSNVASDVELLTSSKSTTSPRSSEGSSIFSQNIKKIEEYEDFDKLLSVTTDTSRSVSNENSNESPTRKLFDDIDDNILTNFEISKSSVSINSPEFSSYDTSRELLRLSVDSTDYYQSVWNLVDSLFKILGPMDESPAWVSTNILDRMKLARSVGFFRGLTVVNQMSESVESMVSTNDDNKNSISANNMKLRDTPISKAIDGVFWIMLRVLLNLFVQGSQITVPENVQSPHVMALKKLSSQLDELKSKSKDYYNSECLYVIGRIFRALFKSNQPSSSPWFREGLKLSMMLLHQQSNYLCQKISQLQEHDLLSKKGKEDNKKVVDIKLLHCLSKESLVRKMSNKENLLDSSINSKNIFSTFKIESSMKSEDIVMNAISICLPILPEDNFTWNDWNDVMDPILEESQKIEDELMSSRLNDQSYFKPKIIKVGSPSQYNPLIQIIYEFVEKQNNYISKYFKLQLKNIETKKKKLYMKWFKLLEEIASERGPWGEGLNNSSEVFWAIDATEDNLRMRMKTRRNPHGNRHETSTVLSQSGSLSASATSSPFVKQRKQAVDQLSISNSKNLRRLSTNKVNIGIDSCKSASKYSKSDLLNSFVIDEYMNDSDSNYSEGTLDDIDFEDDNNNNTSKQVNDKILFSRSCEIITPSTNSTSHKATGLIEITKSKIIFNRNELINSNTPSNKSLSISVTTESQLAYQVFPNTQWETNDIINIQSRLYLLRMIAVEIFFITRISIFIKFSDKTSAYQFLNIIRKKVRPPLLSSNLGNNPETVLQSTTASSGQQLTIAWQNREISNFEYIMKLNTIAGRSYNDLGQYPIFPWVLNDYTSSTIDLKDSSIYRDFKWPIGAQNEHQRETVISKYNDLLQMNQSMGSIDDSNVIQPFHFGTHYSVAGFVIWYLIRCEPFTSLHIQLQDGKFDKADRLFDSISSTWKSCITNSTDAKELIPELFYLPECLVNDNNINFGATQSGKIIDNVRLPPWANNDPYYFIYKHREALESEYVSKNLHHWIDLIFGYKQKPPYLPNSHPTAAVDACNVYYYLTYSGAVDLDKLYLQDKQRYEQTICQISEFGQTPNQLFIKPHPKRKFLKEIDIVWQIASIVRGVDTLINDEIPRPKQIIGFKVPQQISKSPILFIYECNNLEKLITIDSNRIIGYHTWQSLPPDVPPHFKIKIDSSAWELSKGRSGSNIISRITSYSSASSNKERRIGVPFAPPIGLPKSSPDSGLFAVDDSKQIFKPWTAKKYEKIDKMGSKDFKLSPGSNPLNERPSLEQNDLKRYVSEGKKRVIKNRVPLDFTSDKISSVLFDESRLRSQSEITLEYTPTSTSNRKRAPSSFDIENSSLPVKVSDEHLSSQLFAVIPECKLLFSVGHWDCTLRITSLETGKLVQTLLLHNGVITCVAVAKDFGQYFIATGSRDCTVMIWNSVNASDKDEPLTSEPQVLYGHDDAVTSIAVCPEQDIIISGSQDGTLIVHSLRSCTYIRSIINGIPQSVNSPVDTSYHIKTNLDVSVDELKGITKVSAITWIGISKEAIINTYVAEERLLCSYTINGHLLAMKIVPDRLYAFAYSEDGFVLVTGGDSCLIVLRWCRTLELAKDGPRKGFEAVIDGCDEISAYKSIRTGMFNSPIRSLHFTKYERHLLVGLETGEIKVLAQESQYLRERLLKKLEAIGFSV